MLHRERQQIAIAVLAVMMVVGFVFFRYRPLKRQLQAFEQTKAAKRLYISKAEAQSERLVVLRQQMEELSEAVSGYNKNIPAQKELGIFLHRITELMNRHRLAEQLIQPGEKTEADGMCCIPVKMHCKGRLAQIFEFYKSLEALDRLVRIENVKLSNDKDLKGEVKMQTEAFIYHRSRKQQG